VTSAAQRRQQYVNSKSHLSEWAYSKVNNVEHTYFHVLRDLVGNNNSNFANYIFYLTKKSNQPEDGS